MQRAAIDGTLYVVPQMGHIAGRFAVRFIGYIPVLP